MAIHTFSSKAKETEGVELLKSYCKRYGLNFSHVVIKALKESKEYERARQQDQSAAN